MNQVADAGIGACLKRVEVAAGTGNGGVVAVEDREGAIPPEHPGGLGKGELGLGHVTERRMEDDDVQRLVLERERTCIALDEREIGKVAGELATLREKDRRRIDADDRSDARMGRQRTRHGPASAAHLGDTRVSRKLDVREVRVAHVALLWVARPKLEDVDQPFDDRRFRLGDRGVDVRHPRLRVLSRVPSRPRSSRSTVAVGTRSPTRFSQRLSVLTSVHFWS